jgi:multisubunit Na+/H+ antiporter MnhB subunit
MRRILAWCSVCLLLGLLGALLLSAVVSPFWFKFSGTGPAAEDGSPQRLQEHFFLRGVEESGAINLVSAIYLGYRAFDTLAETIVLVLSVAGVLLITGAR